jgi:hypothetical protein
MAIVKANYVKRGVEAKNRAKATIRYIQERPGKQKEKQTRELFGADGTLTRDQVYRMIDEAGKGTLFYRLVVAPDPRKEDSLRDLNLAELTKQTMTELENRLKTHILFAAVEHNDHAPHRHAHVLAILNRKLARADINFLKSKATAASLLQRRILDLKQERSQSVKYKRALKPLATGRGVRTNRDGRLSSAPPWRIRPACPSCSEGNADPMRKISANLHKCSSCGIVVRQTGIGMQIEHTSGWGRGLEIESWA